MTKLQNKKQHVLQQKLLKVMNCCKLDKVQATKHSAHLVETFTLKQLYILTYYQH